MKISWFGHCCYLVEINSKRFLFDPYDTFKEIDMGRVAADYVIISSSWHDHGNIGASPKAYVLSYAGEYKFEDGIKFTGIETEETRGTKNVIWILNYSGEVVANFADWGDPEGAGKLSPAARTVLAGVNTAMMRINYIDLEKDHFCYDLALQVCKPKVVIPEHYFPKEFINEAVPVDTRNEYLAKLAQVDRMVTKTGYQRKRIEGFEFDLDNLESNILIDFQQIAPQVKYLT